MNLTVAEKTENYPIYRIVSENNIWEVGVYPTIFGARVSCNRIGSGTYLKGGYCCGDDRSLMMQVLLYVSAIVKGQPEDITEREMDALLPNWTERPIAGDTLEALSRLALKAEEKSENNDATQ